MYLKVPTIVANTRQRKQLGSSNIVILWGVFNKTIIPLALVGYEVVIANAALRAPLAIYHLISNARGIIVKYSMHNLARNTLQLLHTCKRQTSKSAKKSSNVVRIRSSPNEKFSKCLLNLSANTKVCQNPPRCEFSKKHMAAAQVKDETIRKGT